MSAGTGVYHSEYNASRSDELHFLQIWILPERPGLPPSYAQRRFDEAERRARLRLLVSPDGADGSLTIHQDARIFGALLAEGERVAHELAPGRGAWVQVARGAVELGGQLLAAGDGAAVEGEREFVLRGVEPSSELLLFDLA
ncbi:MAG TPA: pirin family protein, partial [Sandaracinaceae bacterium]